MPLAAKISTHTQILTHTSTQTALKLSWLCSCTICRLTFLAIRLLLPYRQAAILPYCHLPLATCFYATNHWHNLKPRSSAQCSVLSTLVARALRCLLYYFCCCSFQCGGIVGLSVHSMHATLSDCHTDSQTSRLADC